MPPEFAAHRPGGKQRAWDDAVVRELCQEDAPRCARLLADREGWTCDRAERTVESWRSAPADVGLSLVAERRGVVQAYARAAVLDPAARGGRGPNGWYLVGLLVAPEARRRGIGSLLTRARLDRLGRHVEEVWFFANTRNRPSIDLHLGLGFALWTSDFSMPGVEFSEGAGALYRWTRATSG